MTPSLPVATDNIYKFACLFGLALIVSSIFAFVSTYTSSLDRKIRYSETIIPLEAKAQRTKTEEDLLAMNRQLMQVTKSNEKFAASLIGVVLSLGVVLSAYGATQWHKVVQRRDDKLAELQVRKLEAEVAKLESARQLPPKQFRESADVEHGG
jgi:hypothetical protein